MHAYTNPRARWVPIAHAQAVFEQKGYDAAGLLRRLAASKAAIVLKL